MPATIALFSISLVSFIARTDHIELLLIRTPIFLLQLKNFFRIHPPAPNMAVATAATYLHPTVVRHWEAAAEPLGGANQASWDDFEREMGVLYGQPDETVGAIMRDLNTMKQMATEPASIFLQRFLRRAGRLPEGRKLSESQKILQIEHGLLPGVRMGLQFLLDAQPGDGDTWASFTVFKKMVLRADTTYRSQLARGEIPSWNPAPSAPPAPTRQPAPPPVGIQRSQPRAQTTPVPSPSTTDTGTRPRPPMGFGPRDSTQRGMKRSTPPPIALSGPPKSQVTRAQLRAEGRCYVCRERGHTMNTCPTRASKRAAIDTNGQPTPPPATMPPPAPRPPTSAGF